jgi:hypothetical protein
LLLFMMLAVMLDGLESKVTRIKAELKERKHPRSRSARFSWRAGFGCQFLLASRCGGQGPPQSAGPRLFLVFQELSQ